MQIKIGETKQDYRRVDFYGNATEGIDIELVSPEGMTYLSKKISEKERLMLIETLTRTDNGRAV